MKSKSLIEIVKYRDQNVDNKEIEKLLFTVYVDEGYTNPSSAGKMFTIEELEKRGQVILAISSTNILVGIIICALPSNPYRQIANEDEAEMHLLGVLPEFRGNGVGKILIESFEEEAKRLGFKKGVLSTQTSMESAHKLYTKLGYEKSPERNWSKNDRSFFAFTKNL